MTTNHIRCINLDWLECYVLEPLSKPCTPEYFRVQGYLVHERDYGTRVYQQMFTLDGPDGLPFMEIRRLPASALSQGGILPSNATHLRLTNRTCYFDNAAGIMADFITKHHYTFQRISRVDVCLDFEKFDSGDDPQRFLDRYIRHVYSKINQGRIHQHGEDQWDSRQWNSVSWGNPKSQIGTKLYNKTKELREMHDKPYIRHAWFEAGLIDNPISCTKKNPDGTEYTPDIWRVEFSVRSSVKNWFVMEIDGNMRHKHSIPNTLKMWDGRLQLIAMFSSLAQHYFHFKYYEKDKRKDICKDKILFIWQPNAITYHVEHPAGIVGRDNALESLLRKLGLFRQTHTQQDLRAAIDTIIQAIESDKLRNDLVDPFSIQELEAMRIALRLRSQGNNTDPSRLISSLSQLLKSHDCF